MLWVEMGRQYWEEPQLKVWMALDQDLVTGDLKGSSSMTVLFLRSSGVGFTFRSGLRLRLTGGGWISLPRLGPRCIERAAEG